MSKEYVDEYVRGFEFVSRVKGNSDYRIPERSTKSSAGYDIYSPEDVIIKTGEQANIKTGIKVYMLPWEVFLIFCRSSVGIKKGLQLPNAVGVIDSDYYNNPDNEGEFMVCLKNCTNEEVKIQKGEKIAQGIFMSYLTADNDNADGERVGGLGSTGA